MRPLAAIARRGIVGVAVGFSVLAVACGDPGGAGSGSGGGGAGGLTGFGGTPPTLPDAALGGMGGGATGAGGTASTSTPPGSGGAAGAGGAAGGATTVPPGSGGTIPTSSDGGRTGTGGRTGLGGSADSGGRSGNGGAGAQGGAGSSGSGGKPDAAAGGGAGAGSGGAGAGGTSGAAPVPSAGCGKDPPASGRQSITAGGTTRELILDLPDPYDKTHPYRLIFGFHGAKYSAEWVATGQAPANGVALSGPYFGIESASAGSAIFVAPQAAGGGWAASDLAFVDALLAQLEAQLCIDETRVFSVGFSMGAIMTLRLACERADVFRGVAPMSGSLPSPCPAGQPIAYWSAHATNDQTISPSQGQAARDKFIERNGCGTQTSAPDANDCVTYQGCKAGYPVTWCTFTGTSSEQNGHEPAPFAGPAIWKFIEPL